MSRNGTVCFNGKSVRITKPRRRPTQAEINKEGKLAVEVSYLENLEYGLELSDKLAKTGNEEITLSEDRIPSVIIFKKYKTQELMVSVSFKRTDVYQLDVFEPFDKKCFFTILVDLSTKPISCKLAEVYTNNKEDFNEIKTSKYDEWIKAFFVASLRYIQVIKPDVGERSCTILPVNVFGKPLI